LDRNEGPVAQACSRHPLGVAATLLRTLPGSREGRMAVQKALLWLASMAFVLTLTFDSVALAHDGEERPGTPWLKIALVGGGVVVLGVGAYSATRRRG